MGLLSLLKRSKIIFILLVFTFIMSGLIVNCLQFLTLPLYFANKRLFRIINAKLVYLHWCGEWTHDNRNFCVPRPIFRPLNVACPSHFQFFRGVFNPGQTTIYGFLATRRPWIAMATRNTRCVCLTTTATWTG